MKSTRVEARSPQLKPIAPSALPPAPDDASQSGIRPAVDPSTLQASEPAAPVALPASDVTVVFRGVLPMERLVQMIRRRAAESAPATPLCVEVERYPDAQRWRVRVHSANGELSALESGPFLAVTRAFALLRQAS